jgi:hypothetical protein
MQLRLQQGKWSSSGSSKESDAAPAPARKVKQLRLQQGKWCSSGSSKESEAAPAPARKVMQLHFRNTG